MRQKVWPAVLLAGLLLASLVWGIAHRSVWISLSNAFVAIPAVVLAYLFLKMRARNLKAVTGLLWLLFLPNTAYLFTDVGHMTYQWQHTVPPHDRVAFLAQYVLLEAFGAAVFFLSMIPIERVVSRARWLKRNRSTALVVFNLMVAFGVTLGRFQHVNSWVVFLRPLDVLRSALHIFGSVDLLAVTLALGAACSCVYFMLRSMFLRKLDARFHLLTQA